MDINHYSKTFEHDVQLRLEKLKRASFCSRLHES